MHIIGIMDKNQLEPYKLGVIWTFGTLSWKSSIASFVLFMSSSCVLAWVWQPGSPRTSEIRYPSLPSSIITLYSLAIPYLAETLIKKPRGKLFIYTLIIKAVKTRKGFAKPK